MAAAAAVVVGGDGGGGDDGSLRSWIFVLPKEVVLVHPPLI